jgi:peroxiredoxin
VAALALCALLAPWSEAAGPAAGREGDAAPELVLTSLEGEKLDLSSLRGKVVHLVFVAVWCEPCERELPALKELALRHGRRGYRQVFVGVRNRQDRDRLADWAERQGLDVREVHYDAEGEAARSLGVRYLPHHTLIDREGTIRMASERLPSDLDTLLAELLATEPR